MTTTIGELCLEQATTPFRVKPSSSKAYRLLGVEVEIEAYGYDPRVPPGLLRRPRFWDTIPDGSLRAGIEVVGPPAPYSTYAWRSQVLSRLLQEGKYHSSVRCGLHTHVDVRDLTMEQLLSVAVGFALLEPVFFALCSPQRLEGIYCRPWHRLMPIPPDTFAAPTARAIYFRLNQTPKYSSLNLSAIGKYGTIEFRMAQFDIEDNRNNLEFYRTCRDLVNNTMDRSTKELLHLANNTPEQLLVEVLPKSSFPAARLERLMDDYDSIGVAESLLPKSDAHKAYTWRAGCI